MIFFKEPSTLEITQYVHFILKESGSVLNRTVTEAGQIAFSQLPQLTNLQAHFYSSTMHFRSYWIKDAQLGDHVRQIATIHGLIRSHNWQKVQRYVLSIGLILTGALEVGKSAQGLKFGLSYIAVGLGFAAITCLQGKTKPPLESHEHLIGNRDHNGWCNGLLTHDLSDPAFKPLLQHDYPGDYQQGKTPWAPQKKVTG